MSKRSDQCVQMYAYRTCCGNFFTNQHYLEIPTWLQCMCMSNSRPYQHFYSRSLHSEVVFKNVNTTYVHVKHSQLNMHV